MYHFSDENHDSYFPTWQKSARNCVPRSPRRRNSVVFPLRDRTWHSLCSSSLGRRPVCGRGTTLGPSKFTRRSTMPSAGSQRIHMGPADVALRKKSSTGPALPAAPWRGSWARLQGCAAGGSLSRRRGRVTVEMAPCAQDAACGKKPLGCCGERHPRPSPARPQRSGPSTPGVGAVDVCGSRACSGRPLWLSRSFHFHRHDGVALGPSGGESAPHRQA